MGRDFDSFVPRAKPLLRLTRRQAGTLCKRMQESFGTMLPATRDLIARSRFGEITEGKYE
jgi:hypothetical protein